MLTSGSLIVWITNIINIIKSHGIANKLNQDVLESEMMERSD